jgi:hypothetical protein
MLAHLYLSPKTTDSPTTFEDDEYVFEFDCNDSPLDMDDPEVGLANYYAQVWAS